MEVITLNKATFFKNCNKLISSINMQPDLVVGVLNGGGYILNEVRKDSKLNNCNFQHIAFNNRSFKNYLVFRLLLKLLPYGVLNRLRIYESKKVNKAKSKLDLNALNDCKLDFNHIETSSKPIKNVLIVDDAIDSGKTMYIVKNNLEKLFPNSQIKVAVISWTIETSIVKPDFYTFKNVLVRFPWSKDYKGKDFEKKSFSS